MATKNNVSLIERDGARFLITDRPSEGTVEKYLAILKEYGVNHLVRVCEPSYSVDLIKGAKIVVHELAFEDGDPPSDDIIERWFEVNKDAFAQQGGCIAVHCVAGLGRAPIMVALSLIELGMDPEDAVFFIRERRKGAINSKQLDFLMKYKRRRKKSRPCVCM
eukprot:m.269339 g.269339  ORF g.269339 m.269339 type:complete len:163 (-) comp54736_c0_seq1:376-864(-)